MQFSALRRNVSSLDSGARSVANPPSNLNCLVTRFSDIYTNSSPTNVKLWSSFTFD